MAAGSKRVTGSAVTERRQIRRSTTRKAAAGAGNEGAGLAVRRVALEILGRVDRRGSYADVLLGNRLPAFGDADRRMLTLLVLGTLAWRGRIDYEIEHLARRPVDDIEPAVRDILRLGLFQIRFLDRVPSHAAVDTAVTLTRQNRSSAKAHGFVNAVLRQATRRKVELPPREADEAGYLAVRWSHPRWLVERLIEWFGVAEAESLMAANNEAAPTALRLNLARASRDEILACLVGDGMEIARDGRFAETVILKGAPRFDSASFRDGLFHTQSEASQIVSRLLAPAPGATVVDCAAAPGGKTTHLAEVVGPGGRVIGLDTNLAGLRSAESVARRLGDRNVLMVQADMSGAIPLRPDSFDFVLLDAPCTGLGTMREHPELRWRLRPDDPARMGRVQSAMLSNVATLVRRGGAIVYAVCSLAPEEGAGVVTDFLGAHRDFALDSEAPARVGIGDLAGEGGTILLRPDRGGFDGFFAARLTRR